MNILMFFPSILITLAYCTSCPECQENATDVSIASKMSYHPCFIENEGQLNMEIGYYMKSASKKIYFSPNGVTFSLIGKDQHWNVKIDFIGANTNVKLKGVDRQETIFNYFIGKHENWYSGIPTFSKIIYEDLWPGIDLVYSGTANQLKYKFTVKPGSDPNSIRFMVSGASDVVIGNSGILQIKTPLGNIEDECPTAFQGEDGKLDYINVKYNLSSDHSTVGFNIGCYNHQDVLVIDPVVIYYSGYLGGMSFDTAYSIAVDEEGSAYITGGTGSTEYDYFPIVGGYDPSFNGGTDVFIAKISASGDSLIYCSYLGGKKDEWALSIALDPQGNAYIGGYTNSSEDDGFPTKLGPDLTYNGGNSDAFVAKISNHGSDLIYCGYIGGFSNEVIGDIVVNNQGDAYVTGLTHSSETRGFPVAVGPDLTYNGEYDSFVAKITSSGSQLEYCGYIGGSNDDGASGIALDSDNNVYIGGSTESSISDGFPAVIGPDLTHNGDSDGFVAKLDSSGTTLIYCGYIGGNKVDTVTDIQVHDQFAYVTGDTVSKNFPVKIGPDLSFNGGDYDGFVAKVAVSGDSLVYCGYIGGSSLDYADGIAVDNQGCAYVTGDTYSSEKEGFPVLVGPDLTFNGFGLFEYDAYIAKVAVSGDSLAYCGYIGGLNGDGGSKITVDSIGNAYVTGNTHSSEENGFPVVVGPDVTYNDEGLYGDAFITKIGYALNTSSNTISVSTGAAVNFTLCAGSGNENRQYLLLGSFHGSEPGIPLPNGGETLPLVWDSLTDCTLSGLNGPIFTNFQVALNEYSQGTAVLNCQPLRPNQIGKMMTFAYCLEGNPDWDFVSNPVEIEFVP